PLGQLGKYSQILNPSSEVGIVPYSPRMMSGASGFGSQVSCWDGPPPWKMKTTDLALMRGVSEVGTACASKRKRSTSDVPSRVRLPAWIKCRRPIFGCSAGLQPGRPILEVIDRPLVRSVIHHRRACIHE